MTSRTCKGCEFFGRYADLVPDFPGFLQSLEDSVPTAIRVNTLLVQPEDVAQGLRRKGIDLRPTPVEKNFWVAPGLSNPGHLIEHLMGQIYAQVLSSGLPPLTLNPKPGETVLDLCAAPGSKTTQMAAQMQNRGRIVANEPSMGRHAPLLTNLRRMGVTNTLVTGYPGQSFPLRHHFNKVLVDAPCSGEGNGRIGSDGELVGTGEKRGNLTRAQKDLLVRGFDLLAGDGVLVYSTCSYNPREDEAVVDHLLKERPARVVPIELNVPHDPGITHWQGDAYHEDLVHAWRIYPHRLNTVGFFLAKIGHRG